MKIRVIVCAFSCARDPDRRFGSGAGGEGVLGKNMVLQLSRFYEVSVLTDVTNKEAIKKEKQFSGINFYYVGLPDFLNFTKKWIQIYAYLWQIKAYFIAKNLNKKQHFDVFHHVTYANDWMASFIGALLPIPYIRGPGGGAHRVPKKFVKEYSFKQRLKEKIRSVGQWIFRHDPFFIAGQNRAKVILVCNQEAFSALPERWQNKACFFPVNGVSSEDLLTLKNKSNRDGDKFSVLTAGKLIKIKGFDLAIKAFKIFSDRAGEAEFIIIGDGPESQNLKKLADELNIGKGVIFTGWLPREGLFKKMLSCDVFLFPSLRDGGGNVVVEAMAAGKPVVCMDLAGPGFHIDESCGIKIKPESPRQAIEKMAEALKKLYFNKELRIKLGKGAAEKAEKDYDWNKLGGKLNEIYIATLNYKKVL